MPNQIVRERALAVQILLRVARDGAYANLALKQALDRQPHLQPRQSAFITELVNGTLRNVLHIDYLLNTFSKTPTLKMKPYILMVLRTAVYQIGWMNKVPPSAAVNEAVNLTKTGGYQPLSGFVNGVLRHMLRQKDNRPERNPLFPFNAIPYPDPLREPAAYLTAVYSFPSWLADAAIDWLGRERAFIVGQNSLLPPTVTVCVNPLKTTRPQLLALLQNEGVDGTVSAAHPETLYLRHTAALAQLAAYRQGLFHVMDDGALLAVKALGLAPGQTLLDLCAAPGGKSFAGAYAMQNNGKIFAFDIHEHKIKLIRESAARLGLTCITSAIQDAEQPVAALLHRADAVLLDAPCSGLGILRKKPDIKYTHSIQEVLTLAKMQRTMLTAAANYVKPGGVLVYCTCTIAREENIDNVQWFTRNFPFTTAPPLYAPSAWPDSFIEDNTLQILPGKNNDGFFIARMIRDTAP